MELHDLIRLVKSGRKEEALRLVKSALQQSPAQIEYLLFFAGVTSDLDEGIRALQRVLELDPQNAAAKKGLADLLEKKAKAQSAAVPSADVILPPNEVIAPAEPVAEVAPTSDTDRPADQGAASVMQELIAFAGDVHWKMRGLDLPLREAIQAGHVTERDLEWAGQKAYNPVLAWAAAVMLRAAEIRESTLRLEEALAVTWPFKNLNAPIGELLQQGKITLWNLTYTLMRGPDLRLRQACALAGYALITQRITVTKTQEEQKAAESKDAVLSQSPAAQVPVTPSGAVRVSSESRPAQGGTAEEKPARAESQVSVTPSGAARVSSESRPAQRETAEEKPARVESQAPVTPPGAARASSESHRTQGSVAEGKRAQAEPAPSVSRPRPVPTGEARPAPGPGERLRRPAGLPTRKGPAIYKGSDYLDRQILKKARLARYLYWGIAVLLGLMALSVPVMLLFPKSIGKYFALGAFGIAGVLYFVMPRFEMAVQERNQYIAGQKGEETLIRWLQGQLDESWAIFRNIDLPDRQGDIDVVLVGPGGMYVLEVKVYSGQNRNFGERWQRKSWGRWMTLDQNPSKQARKNAARLSNFLREAGLNVWVEPRVVWAGDGELRLEKPAVLLWKLSEPARIEAELKKGSKSLQPETVQRIVGMLKIYLRGYHHSG